MGNIRVDMIRHGVTTNNLQGRFGGRLEFPLAEEGRAQLYELVEKTPYEPVEKLYISPTIRCRQTARILFPGMGEDGDMVSARDAGGKSKIACRSRCAAVAVRPSKLATVENLKELFFGDAEGKLAAEVRQVPDIGAFDNQALDFRFPGGESMGECLERAVAALDEILSDAAELRLRHVGVITHSMVLSLLCRYRSCPPLSGEALYCPNGMGFSFETTLENWRQTRRFTIDRLLPQGAVRPLLSQSPYHHADKE
ncbi:MAG: histidine phosphatase family protein [Christensenellales bacterium]